MTAFDLPPKLWLPPKPALIRAASKDALKLAAKAKRRAMFFPIGVPFTGASIAFIAHTTDTSNATVYTFTSQAIGAAAADRYVVVAIMVGRSLAGGTITAVTIGGNTATRHIQATGSHASNTNSVISCIAGLLVTAGTTATIVVTASAASLNCSIGVYILNGLGSTTPFATGSGTTAAATSASGTCNVPANGILVLTGASGNAESLTLTGAPEDFDLAVETQQHHAGHSAGMSAETARAISTAGASSIERSIVGASWA